MTEIEEQNLRCSFCGESDGAGYCCEADTIIKKQQKDLDTAIEGLKYYSDEKNWVIHRFENSRKTVERAKIDTGKAKETLKQIESKSK